ncbi:MAG: hypothetical protein RL497_2891 [Pseudomonadota bacterium]|jgi:glucose/arabinose dehydrogenase
MARLPDERWLITERGGNLVIVTPDGQVSNNIQGLPAVDNRGEGGLLDVSLDPNFASNRWVYFTYSAPLENGQSSTTVGRGRLSSDDTRLENWQKLFSQTPTFDSNKNFGARLAWDKTGLLYVTLGERFTPESRLLAQDLTSTLGKVIRIKPDGSTPANNPFVATFGNTLPVIWSYGHRNPQGAAIHPQTGELWTLEQGAQGGDEVNRIQSGKNYGWPVITYGEDFDGKPFGQGITTKTGMEQPVYFWDPVIAPAGIAFYEGALFPNWQNNLLISSLNPGGLVRLVFAKAENKVIAEERLVPELEQVRDVDIARDGAVWVITDKGQLNRLTPALNK